MLICETCGVTLHRGAVLSDPDRDSEELAGRLYYGLRPGAALCPSCLDEVRQTGAAVSESEYSAYCSLCRKEIHRSWGSSDRPGAPRPGARTPSPDRAVGGRRPAEAGVHRN